LSGKEAKMLKSCFPQDVKLELKLYIEMCKKAKNYLDPYPHFEHGDFYAYKKDPQNEGVNRVDKIQGDIIYALDLEEWPSKIEDCTWLPNDEQLRKKESRLTQVEFKYFCEYEIGDLIKLFTMPEQRWLAFFIFVVKKKIWSSNKRDWVKI
jgi:hypothetical protein